MTKGRIEQLIDGCGKNIEKLAKKLERIHKAEDSGWQNNPYFYSEYDLKCTRRELKEAKEKMEKYKQQEAEIIMHENSRNVPAITAFLDNWKNNCRKWYIKKNTEFLEAREAWYEEDRKYTEIFNYNTIHGALSREEMRTKRDEYRQKEKSFRSTWNFMEQLYSNGDLHFEERLEKMLSDEYNRKYDFLIDEVMKITGTITDASCLSENEKGDLDGYIIGEKGKARINTFGAGGWNIQCFHFRTRVTDVTNQE